MLTLLAIIVLAYLVGSIHPSIIVSKLTKGIDIRNYGSGNAGGPNVMRVLGWKKGIATALGMLLMIATVDMLIAVGAFIIVVYVSRYVSLGSIIAAVVVPLALVVRENIFNVDIQGYNTILPFIIITSLLVIFTHRKNLVKLLNGNESKITFSKKNNTSLK